MYEIQTSPLDNHILALVREGGEFSAAARDAREQGYSNNVIRPWLWLIDQCRDELAALISRCGGASADDADELAGMLIDWQADEAYRVIQESRARRLMAA